MKRCLIALTALIGFVQPSRSAELYQEPYRPQFHFTPATNWMNDPNGMVYLDGEYHLFYQHNPFGTKWGHMSWGHAVSRDLVHWEHLPIALYEENSIMIFSGSAVVDHANTSGFGRNGEPPLVAIYTGHYTSQPLQNQQIAYSNDRGRTWTKYEGNPVLDLGERDFRDPKVIWHEGTKRWVMAVAWPVPRQVRFYASPDLKNWTHLSDFGPAGSTTGIWECPDLFPLRVEGSRRERWVLIVSVGGGGPAGGSAMQYFVGDFDGTRFTLDASYPQPQPEFAPEGELIADFEGDNYGEWKAAGEAFGTGPARGKIGGQQEVDGFRGRGLVNTFLDGDRPQGTLTSPEFEITRDYLNFLIGGGKHPGETCLNLVVDGRTVRTATGDDAERLTWKSWPVQSLRGRRARLEIVDRHSGGWGHISVDQIMLADQAVRPATQPALWVDYGPDFYAAVSWSDVPKQDGRRLWLGWMSNWQYANDVPTEGWRNAMSIPRELALRETSDGLRLIQKPVRELERLRAEPLRLRHASLGEANGWLRRHNVSGPLWEIEAELEPSAEFSLRLFPAGRQVTTIRVSPGEKTVSLDRTQSGLTGFSGSFPSTSEAPLPAGEGPLRLRLFLDTSSIELFVNERTILTALVFPREAGQPMELSAPGQNFRVRELVVWKLKPAVPGSSQPD